MIKDPRIKKDEFALRLFLFDIQEGNWDQGTTWESLNQSDKNDYLKCADNIIKNYDEEQYPPFILDYLDQRDTESNPYRRKA